MSDFKKNIFKSIKIYEEKFKEKFSTCDTYICNDGFIYSFNSIKPYVNGDNSYYGSGCYFICKNNGKFIYGPKNVVNSFVVDSNYIIYIVKDGDEKYSFQKFKYDGIKENTFKVDYVRKKYFSKNGKFFMIVDMNGNFNIYDTDTFKFIKNINIKIKHLDTIENVHFSPDGKTVLFVTWNKLIIWKDDNLTHLHVDYEEIDESYYGFFEVYFQDDIIKIAFLNCSIMYIKNGKITKITKRKIKCFFNYFSPDGKILCCYHEGGGYTFLHEDSDSYSDNFSRVKHIGCYTKISPDGKLFIGLDHIENKFEVFDISFIGHKKIEKLEFLKSSTEKNSSINSFFENVLFDINIVKLLFDFLPFSKETSREEMIVN
jgi:WD40 repeat protein